MALELYDTCLHFFAYPFASKSRDFQDTGRENKKHGGHSLILVQKIYILS